MMVPGSVIETMRPVETSSMGFLLSSKVVIKKDPELIIWLGFSIPVKVMTIVFERSGETPTRSKSPAKMTLSVNGVNTVNPVLSYP